MSYSVITPRQDAEADACLAQTDDIITSRQLLGHSEGLLLVTGGPACGSRSHANSGDGGFTDWSTQRNTFSCAACRRGPSLAGVVELRVRLSSCLDETTEETGAVCQRGLDVAEDRPFLHRKWGQS